MGEYAESDEFDEWEEVDDDICISRTEYNKLKFDTLVNIAGWHKFQHEPVSYRDIRDINQHMINECKGKFHCEGNTYVFEDKSDFILCKLKFS